MDDETEDPTPVAEQAPHVVLGYPTPHGWVVPPAEQAGDVGHAEVGPPSDMRKVKAPVDADPVDLAVPDLPVIPTE